jgi:superfamily II RNA helicase
VELDKFQKEAIKYVSEGISVVVTAPTGAGKTLIAEHAIAMALEKNRNVIYTAPIKALSNQKYRDFSAKYGSAVVGIVTGDVTINRLAPVVIMTTEIYRNTILENPEALDNIEWVIFDEVHYIDDYERGTVWEEAIMLSPKHIRFLCLSATIPNIKEFARWIRTIHQQELAEVVETERPVPLKSIFQCQGSFFENKKNLKKFGYLNVPDWSIRDNKVRSLKLRMKPNRIEKMIQHLQIKASLPAIYFAFSRKRTEILARELTRFDFLTREEKTKVISLYNELLSKFNLLGDKTAENLFYLVERGIAYHHAGMLPTLKEVVERLFTSKLIKLIFTTETFALGINMPARTVIFDELKKFYGTHFGNLRTRDFFQMAGRAGRRGMDKMGYVYIRIKPKDIPFNQLLKIVYGKSEPIVSQFNTGYATVLNLYKQFGEKLKDIYPGSLHYFQSSRKIRIQGLQQLENKLKILKELKYFDKDGLTIKGEFAIWVPGYELLTTELFYDGLLDSFSYSELAGVVAALNFEPRKSDHCPPLPSEFLRIKLLCDRLYRDIHKREVKYGIPFLTKGFHFHLSNTVVLWLEGRTFEELMEISPVDEGEVVRSFRMILQILRQFKLSPFSSNELKEKSAHLIYLINRDVIDAEKQLRE